MANDFLSFKLPDDFVDSYREKEVPWGFPIGAGNSLGELTFITKYSRRKEDGSKETWVDTGRRVIEGMFSIQKDWCKENRLPWNENKAQATAKDAFDRLFVGKWTPPGRGLWMMGTEFVHAKKNSAALQNCSFLSTEHISTRSVHDATWPFVRLMEMSMLGVGVGFDTKGADKLTIHQPLEEVEVLVVEDSREGWCESVGKLLESYFFAGRPTFDFDYSLVRPSGEPINGFGGTAAGPGPLIDLHNSLKAQFNGREGEKLSSTDIVDIQNKIGRCVVAGNVRRSAEIALGSADDKDFLDLKNWEVNPDRMGANGWGHTSNNSIIAEVGGNYDTLAERIANNGEPGLVYLDLCRKYGRLIDPPNNKDYRVAGTNPCAEQSLESGECCTLTETFPIKHESLEDYKRTIKVAYLYAKSVTLLPTHWPETNSIMQRNRRIGCSISGVAQFAERYGWAEMKTWLNQGYDEVQRYDVVYSDWLGVRESIKTTSVKPSGCQKPDTMVTTLDGIYMLGELGNVDGDQWQYLGKAVPDETTSTNKATQFFVNGLANTKVVKLKSGLTLESTLNHQYKVLTANGLEWRRADELKEGDTLPYSVGDYLAQETNDVKPYVSLVRAEKPYCNVREMTMPTHLTEDLAWLVGLMVGDGSVHTKGIRIAGSIAHLDRLERAAEIVENLFGIRAIIYGRTKSEQNADLYINSTWFREWLRANGLLKAQSNEISIPLKVRQSPVAVIEAFLDGYCAADGAMNHLGRTFVTISKTMAEQVVCVLRAIGHDASMREMPPTQSSWGSNMRYWVQEKKGRLGQIKKLPTRNQQDIAQLDNLHLRHMMPDYVVAIEDGYNMTVDIEVPDGNTYLANSYVSHNTVSLLFGVTPGVHWPTADVYIRRMRLASNDPLLEALGKAGYHTEPDVMDPVHSVVVELPTRGPQVRTEREVTMWEKASLAVLAQRYWADNQVSVTITFQPQEKDQIGALLRSVDGQLKSISMLPLLEEGGAYAQMPYERISEEVWEESTKKVKAIKWASLYAGKALDAEGEKFCSNDVCMI